MNRQDATGAPFRGKGTEGHTKEPSPEVDALARSVIDAAGEGRLDLLLAGKLPVELKAIEALAPIHKAQVISYLKATGLQLGLLINFNVPVLRSGVQRVVLSHPGDRTVQILSVDHEPPRRHLG